MNNYFKLAAIFVILQSNLSLACVPAKLELRGKSIELCHDKVKNLYLSKSCSSIETCFFEKKIKLQFYPNQSPGFSLCYQLGGDAFFGIVKGVEDKIPFCFKNGHYADHESLLLQYRSSK